MPKLASLRTWAAANSAERRTKGSGWLATEGWHSSSAAAAARCAAAGAGAAAAVNRPTVPSSRPAQRSCRVYECKAAAAVIQPIVPSEQPAQRSCWLYYTIKQHVVVGHFWEHVQIEAVNRGTGRSAIR